MELGANIRDCVANSEMWMQKVQTCLIQDNVWIWEDLGRYVYKAKGTTGGMMRKGGVESSYGLQEIPEDLQRTPEVAGQRHVPISSQSAFIHHLEFKTVI